MNKKKPNQHIPPLPYRLMTPGPVPLPAEVLLALSRPVQHHRTPEFLSILSRVWQGLSWFFATQSPVLMMTSTGTGAMEAALVNTLSKGDEILVVVSGKFGERWAEMGERYGLKVSRFNVPWGQSVEPDQVSQALQKQKKIKAVLCQAVETSTATEHPIQELAQVIKKESSALFMVDGITGLGAMRLPMDDWGLDVVLAGSQKALMLPTGLSFIALSQAAWKAYEHATLPRYYFDLGLERAANQKGQTAFSSANSHIVALDVVLAHFKKMGLERLIERCALLAQMTRKVGQLLGLEVYSQSPASSVTGLRVPEGLDSGLVRDHLEAKYNVTIMGGQDQLTGKILRLGHLGYIRDEDALATMDFLALTLCELGAGCTEKQRVLAMEQARLILSQGPHVS